MIWLKRLWWLARGKFVPRYSIKKSDGWTITIPPNAHSITISVWGAGGDGSPENSVTFSVNEGASDSPSPAQGAAK
jgi:hypothetical protein